jgi:hypothetical protein
MVAKILVCVLAVSAASAGGAAYFFHGHSCCSSSNDNATTCPLAEPAEVVAPCCMPPSPGSLSTEPNCCEDADAPTPEVLTVKPRELN